MRITVFLILAFSAGTVLQASDSLMTRVGEDTMITRHSLDNNRSEMLFPIRLRHAMRTGWGVRLTSIVHCKQLGLQRGPFSVQSSRSCRTIRANASGLYGFCRKGYWERSSSRPRNASSV